MNELSFQTRLQLQNHRLSTGDIQIKNYVLANKEDVVTMSSLCLSKEIGISNSTLTRFCQKLGYRNFIEFQTLLASELHPVSQTSSLPDKLASYYSTTLCSANELITTNHLNLFIDSINAADKIFVLGLGSSALTANECSIRLAQMGYSSTAMTDSILMQAQSTHFSSKDLIIVVSNSGETKAVNNACKIAKSVNVPICTLTQNCNSSLAQLSTVVLLAGDINCVSDPQFVNSQMPLMYLIDLITYQLLNDPLRREMRDKTLQILLAN